jgi:hypothetical protein
VFMFKLNNQSSLLQQEKIRLISDVENKDNEMVAYKKEIEKVTFFMFIFMVFTKICL